MSDTPPPAESELDPNQILIAEFNNISQAATQANEDRAKVSNYYFVTAGAAVAAIVGAKLDTGSVGVYWGFAAVFGILSGVGFITVFQLAQLRAAWIECVRAMNQIKDHYIAQCSGAKLDEAFGWTSDTIPDAGKKSSVAFLLAVSVMLVDGVMAGVAVVYAGTALGARPNDLRLVAGAALIAAVFGVSQYFIYMRAVQAD